MDAMPDRRLIDLFCCASLLVGAPRDHSPHDIIARRGAVWKCEFQADDRCQRVAFRRDGRETWSTLAHRRTCFFKAKSTFVSVLHSIIKQINGSVLHWRPTMVTLSYVLDKPFFACTAYGLRSRPVHPFSSIASSTDKILSTKYRAVL